MDVPDVSYARSGDVAIAYQVVGEGPPDLVFLPFLSQPLHALAGCRGSPSSATRLAEQPAPGHRQPARCRPLGPSARASRSSRGSTTFVRSWTRWRLERAALLGWRRRRRRPAAVFAAAYPERVERLVALRPAGCGPWVRRAVGATEDALLRSSARAGVQWGRRDVPRGTCARELNPQWARRPRSISNWFVWHHRLTSSPAAWARVQAHADRSRRHAVSCPLSVCRPWSSRKERGREAAPRSQERIAGLASSWSWLRGDRQGNAGERSFAVEAVEAFLECVASSSAIPDTRPGDGALHGPRRVDRAGGGAR